MICKIQVVTLGEDGHQETREIAGLQRTDLKPETLGLTLAEGKMILKDLQQILVEGQVASFLLPKRPCPDLSAVSRVTSRVITPFRSALSLVSSR
jgi:hypothetical protein